MYDKVAQPSARQPTADRLRLLGLISDPARPGPTDRAHEQHGQLCLVRPPLGGVPDADSGLGIISGKLCVSKMGLGLID